MTDESVTVREYLEKNLGPRCPDVEEGCMCCEAWKIFDLAKKEHELIALEYAAVTGSGDVVERIKGTPAYMIAERIRNS